MSEGEGKRLSETCPSFLLVRASPKGTRVSWSSSSDLPCFYNCAWLPGNLPEEDGQVEGLVPGPSWVRPPGSSRRVRSGQCVVSVGFRQGRVTLGTATIIHLISCGQPRVGQRALGAAGSLGLAS